MRKNITLSILFFIFGFFTHAFWFPDVLSNGIADVSNLVIPNMTPTPADAGFHTFSTTINYKEGVFSRHTLTIEVGSYLTIINKSEHHPMWLVSNNPLLATPRGYGQSEAVQVRLDKKGQFLVADKNNPSEKLVIIVK